MFSYTTSLFTLLLAAIHAKPSTTSSMDELLAQGRDDNSTIAEYSITVYYTAMFKKTTGNPITFIDQVIAETNAGYVNSNVPLRAKLHCVLETDIPDGLSQQETLSRFTDLYDGFIKVRRTADVAILLVDHYGGEDITKCGISYFDGISTGKTIGSVARACALGTYGLGYYGFGHEIGHMFGLNPDSRGATEGEDTLATKWKKLRTVMSWNSLKKLLTSMTLNDILTTYLPIPTLSYNHGMVFKAGKYRTIMADNSKGEKRVNYYSSPDIKYRGLPTGTEQNNNARMLTENRFAAEQVGDESIICEVDPGDPFFST